MQRWLVLFVCISLIVVCIRFVHPILRLDGYAGLLWSSILGEDTAYARGYSNAGFLALKEGMSEEEVVALVGEPMYMEESKGERIFGYSRSPSFDSYRIRTVFMERGIVVRVRTEFYLD